MNINFRIKKKLDHFMLDVTYGFDEGVLVIQGESGAGKTTLLDCIAGLKTPDEGEIVIGERTVFGKRMNVPAQNRKIGYLFQNYALFPNMTVKNNIIYGIRNKKEYRDKAGRTQLLEYAESVMETFGIAHLQKKNPRNISGGEKQRVALARAIVTQPELLLLDEPFSALDVKTKETVYKEFADFKKNLGIPTILITHNPEERKLFADHKIFIQSGGII